MSAMSLVATLICNPAEPALDGAALAAAREALPQNAAATWLAESVAADVAFSSDEDAQTIAGRVRAALADRKIDVVVQPVNHRRKRLLLADMDSTMIGQECIDELADYAGLKAHVAAITERAMRGEIAFEPALRERVAVLRGLPISVIDDVLAQRITLTPGARELIGTMRAQGAYTCLVSGGFTQFTGAVRARIGFDEDRANVLETEAGKLAGIVREPILGREAKLATLVELKQSRRIADADTIVVGDGANDLAMIQAAGLGVAYHAKPAVAAAAHARIDFGDLTALLYAQGYRRDEFTA
jgi:phosphoserine phosphatase